MVNMTGIKRIGSVVPTVPGELSPVRFKGCRKSALAVIPQCGQLKPRMVEFSAFWAYILDSLYKYLDISP